MHRYGTGTWHRLPILKPLYNISVQYEPKYVSANVRYGTIEKEKQKRQRCTVQFYNAANVRYLIMNEISELP